MSSVPIATNFADFVDLELYKGINRLVTVQPGFVVANPTAVIYFYFKEDDLLEVLQAPCTVSSVLNTATPPAATDLLIGIDPQANWPIGTFFYKVWVRSQTTPYALVVKGRARIRL